MTSTTPTERALRLRVQAARLQERELPDLIGTAYGPQPATATAPETTGRTNTATQAEIQDEARNALIKRGHLTAEELDSLPVAEATALALERQRAQITALEEQTAEYAGGKRGRDDFKRPPRTLRR
jgi:hypothetical protein